MTRATDDSGCTVLAIAASKGKKSIFDTVLTAVEKDLNPSEVGHYIFSNDL